MIISQSLGDPRLNRNLGNQLFEIAALVGLSKRYGTTLKLPEGWQYRTSFKLDSLSIEYGDIKAYATIQEPAFHCCLDFFDKFELAIKTENVYISGSFQSELYWKAFEKDIRKLLEFTDPIQEFANMFLVDNNIDIEQFVVVSVRRGDFVTDSNHYLLPQEYYMKAIHEFFPDKDIIFFSDDIPWCKAHFHSIGRRVLFAENKNAIEQLSLMSCFCYFIIANSTFSWWGAYLSKVENKKVIRPYYHFDGELKKTNIEDHYPQSWVVYNHYNTAVRHSTYVVNLSCRIERKAHTLQQFTNKPEFEVQIQEPITHPIGTVSLWITLRSIVAKEKEKDSPYFIFCEDDHTFTEFYSAELLDRCIKCADRLQADILSGGVSWVNSSMKTDENLFWISQFTGMQFTVIYNRFYDKLLEVDYDNNVITDYKISCMTQKKWMIYPYLSIQTEFGYSDVTSYNNNVGFVESIFNIAINRFEILNKVAKHFEYFSLQQNNRNTDMQLDIPGDITISTYIINLKERPDRLVNVLAQFDGKTEFDIHIVEACKHQIGAVGLWQSIVKIVKGVIDEDDDVIIICEDDHIFTPNYCRDEFIRIVMEAGEQGAEILSGGIGGFGNVFPTGYKRYWMDWFWCTQFVVIYRSFFKKILNEPFYDSDTADGKISEMASNKMLIYPFISIQSDFGYSDVTLTNNEIRGKITEHFREADERLRKIDQILKYRNNLISKESPNEEFIRRKI